MFRRTGGRIAPTGQGMALDREMTWVRRGFDLLPAQARDLIEQVLNGTIDIGLATRGLAQACAGWRRAWLVGANS
ncbi:MAG: hypothetical protein KF889_09960 [Alphaproteobacteria bacterium]|nr:hypothetical protein [Alphaproteobacteria bacterium]MCW5741146.1 hypothetical protein [Alphaproteobacteria bacterium]